MRLIVNCFKSLIFAKFGFSYTCAFPTNERKNLCGPLWEMDSILIKLLKLTITVISLERLKLAVESWVGREMEERKLKSWFRWELIYEIKL